MEITALYQLFLAHPVVCTDTRSTAPGCIFFALKGDNFDGNLFAAKALEHGAAYAVVDNVEIAKANKRMILVSDVLLCLQQLALHHRKNMPAVVIGLTGSNGKTTTKELLYAVLGSRYKTLATKGNLNNHIGVPLTLLQLRKEHEYAIVEMGANHQGEIATLCTIADPDLGIITNIGKAHIGTMGGIAGIIKTKTELFNHIEGRGGKVYVPSSQSVLMERSTHLQRMTYGTFPTDQVQGEGRVTDSGTLSFRWNVIGVPAGRWIDTQLVGAYNLDNALVAAAVGTDLGIDSDQINAAIERYSPSNNRSQLVKWRGARVVMDAYNANPSSMAEAIKSLADQDGLKALILGEMLELGEYADAEHRTILERVRQMEPALAVFVGKGFETVADAWPAAHFLPDYAAVATLLNTTDLAGMTLLIKGSRRNQLEKILDPNPSESH